MTNPPTPPTSRRAAAEDWLATVDDVLGEDPGTPPPTLAELDNMTPGWRDDPNADWPLPPPGSAPVAVIAESYMHARGWAAEAGLPSQRWWYVSTPDQLAGLSPRATIRVLRLADARHMVPIRVHQARGGRVEYGPYQPVPADPTDTGSSSLLFRAGAQRLREFYGVGQPLEPFGWAAADPAELVVGPPSTDPAGDAAAWIERHAPAGLRLDDWQRAFLRDLMGTRGEVYGWRDGAAGVRFGVDVSRDGPATVVVVKESDGGALTVLDAISVPANGDALARELMDTEGLDGWAARELAARRILDGLLGMLHRVLAPVRELARELAVRFTVNLEPIVRAFRAIGDAVRRAGAALARMFRRRRWSPQRRVDRARRLRVDRAMRRLARRRARRGRRTRR